MMRLSEIQGLPEKAEGKLLPLARRRGKADPDTAASLWKLGFLYDKVELYGLTTHTANLYLSDLQRSITKKINGPISALLDNKLIFSRYFSELAPLAKVVAHTAGGNLLGKLPTHLDFYAKPLSGGAGKGVFRGTIRDGQVAVGDERMDTKSFVESLANKELPHLITETVQPHALLSSFYPNTINTIRLVAMRDADGVFLVTAVLRVGCSTSGYVDNFSGGGFSFGVDIETGVIGEGRRSDGTRATVHPDTKVSISGQTVPYWTEVVDMAFRMMNACSDLFYAGWDIIVTPAGPVVLEGNNHTDVNLLQVHTPLLKSNRVREFYHRHGILDVYPKSLLYG